MTTRCNGDNLAFLRTHIPTPVDPQGIFKEALWVQPPVGEQRGLKWNNGH